MQVLAREATMSWRQLPIEHQRVEALAARPARMAGHAARDAKAERAVEAHGRLAAARAQHQQRAATLPRRFLQRLHELPTHAVAAPRGIDEQLLDLGAVAAGVRGGAHELATAHEARRIVEG